MNRVLTKSVLVDATADEVWQAWTTLEGIKRFFAPDARLDIRPHGKYEILFNPEEPEGHKGAEGCTVLSYVPLKTFSFTWGAPPEFPSARREIAQWVVLHFDEVGQNRTLVRFQEFGWKDDKEGKQVYDYFDHAWEVVLARLAHSFTHGPLNWKHPWRPSRSSRSQDTWSGPWISASIPLEAYRRDHFLAEGSSPMGGSTVPRRQGTLEVFDCTNPGCLVQE